MGIMKIQIAPTPILDRTACYLSAVSVSVQLNQTATVAWELLDESSARLTLTGRTSLTAAQYAQWGSGDDVYVLKCVADNLGLTQVIQ